MSDAFVFEIAMAVSMIAMVVLGLWHSVATRSRRDTVMLLVFGAGFGYVFPFVDINLFGQYTFEGKLTIANLPFHLGMAWYGLYYMSFCLAERIAGPGAGRVKVAVLTAFIFGALEAQWDPTLLSVGVMKLFLPSFHKYPYNFHPGVPMFHAYLGFMYAYGFYVLRRCPNAVAATVAGLLMMILPALLMMAVVPLVEPIFQWAATRFSSNMLITFDVLHFSTAFGPAALINGWILRIIGRRLGAEVDER